MRVVVLPVLLRLFVFGRSRAPAAAALLLGLWLALLPKPTLADDVQPPVSLDVALQGRDGRLCGRVVAEGKGDANVAGVTVAVMRDGKVVARTRTDRAGAFSVSCLPGGNYAVGVAGREGVRWNLCRLWTPQAAPPQALAEARLGLGGHVVRGQGPFSSAIFTESALMAGVVVGAVAAPIIYHNAQRSNRVPASP
jgi:hypothetical protein